MKSIQEAKSPTIRNHFNIVCSKGRLINPKSETQPNMAYTLKELLEKYTSGSLPPVIRKGSYPETEPDLDDPVLLSQERDLTDINVISLRVNELNDIIDEDRRLTELKKKGSEAAEIVNPQA